MAYYDWLKAPVQSSLKKVLPAAVNWSVRVLEENDELGQLNSAECETRLLACLDIQEDLRCTIKKSTAEIGDLLKAMNDKAEVNANLREKVQLLMDGMEDTLTKFNRANQTITLLRQQMEGLKKDLEDVTGEKGKLDEEIAAQALEIESLHAAREAEIKQLQQARELENKQSQEEIDKLTDRIDDFQNKLDLANTKMQQLEANVVDANKKNGQITQERMKLEAEISSKVFIFFIFMLLYLFQYLILPNA